MSQKDLSSSQPVTRTDVESLSTGKDIRLVQLGHMLRNARQEKELSGFDLGHLVHMSQSKVSKIENGSFPAVSKKDIESIIDALGVSIDVRQQVLTQFELTTISPLSMRYIGAQGISKKQYEFWLRERGVKVKLMYSPCLIPGLLQTTDYMSALFVALENRPDDIEAATAERLRRQEILRQQGRKFSFLIGHAALYTAPAGAQVQIEQLHYITEVIQQPNISIGIIPVTAGLPVDANNGFTVMDSTYATAETILYEQQSTDSKEIDQYLRLFSQLKSSAAFDDKAVQLIKSVVKDLS